MHLLVQIGLFVFIFQSANGAILLGSKRCTWGPSYWCSHLGTMKECGSVSYCARIWQRGPVLTADSGSVKSSSSSGDCGFCRLLASDLDRLARDNRTTADDNRRLVTAACDLVPDARQRSLCQAVVDNYLDEAVQLLRAGLSADRLCGALSLCGNGRRDPKLHVAMATQQPAKPPGKTWRAPLAKAAAVSGRLREGFCDLCMEFVNIAKLAAANKAAEAEVVQLIKAGVCARLGDSQSLCNLWVDSYVPEVMRRLANNADPRQICTSAQFCQAAATAAPVKFNRHPLMQLMILQKLAVKPLKDVECQVCEVLVSEARQMLRDNKTQDEIVQFVKDRVCGLIPSERDKCIRAVTEYGPIIFQLLSSELDPNTVCQALGACGKTRAAAAPAAAAPRRRLRIGPQCILCEYVIRELDQMLGSNRTVVAIESALATVCSVMPQTIRQECQDWVSQYTPVVMQLLSQDLNPALVCTVLGLCTGDSRAAPKLAATAASSATTCDICQTVIAYVKTLLKDNATEQEVMNVLEKVCNFLPSQEQPTCRAFIEQYTPYIIQLLLDDTDPQQVCQAIGLCPNSAARSGSLRYRSNGLVQMSNRPANGPIV